MTLNRTEIMTAAWTEAREMMRMGYAAHQLRGVFTYCLRRAWAAAKAAATLLARSAASLRVEVQDMENRDRLGVQGIERLSQLRRAYHAAKAREDAAVLSARQAVETRKARHPHLMAVWYADKAAPRSINLATITEIRLDGLARAYEVAV